MHAWEVGLVGSHVTLYCVWVCAMAGEYEPAARSAHVAAAVEDKVYVWGGAKQSQYAYKEVSHDGPDKTAIILKVDILDAKVSLIN